MTTPRNRREFLVFGVAAALMAAHPAGASFDLSAFVAQVARESITELSNADPTDPARAAALKPILLKYFDMTNMGKHALGGYWKKIDADHQKQYVEQFVNYVASVYAKRFKQYNGKQLEVKRVRDQGERATVFTTVAGDQGARLDWDILTASGAPLIVDIRVDGLSLVDTHRQEFTSVMSQNNGDIAVLMGILKSKSVIN